MSGSPARKALRSAVADASLRTGIEERFWRKVRKTDGCWEWIGWRHRQGYGLVRVAYHMHLAHRLCWLLTFGDPEDKDVLHKCDNPPCVRPDHLFIGTHAQNMEDMVRKGRNAKNERSPAAKLTWDQVNEIRRLYQPWHKKYSCCALARRFSMSRSQIDHILRGWYWRPE